MFWKNQEINFICEYFGHFTEIFFFLNSKILKKKKKKVKGDGRKINGAPLVEVSQSQHGRVSQVKLVEEQRVYVI